MRPDPDLWLRLGRIWGKNTQGCGDREEKSNRKDSAGGLFQIGPWTGFPEPSAISQAREKALWYARYQSRFYVKARAMHLVEFPAEPTSRPSRPVSLLTASDVRHLRYSGLQIVGTVASLALMCLGLVFLPLSALFFAGFVLYFGWKWVSIEREARAGTLRQAECPNCARLLTFRTAPTVMCSFCRHTLSQYQDRLYDL